MARPKKPPAAPKLDGVETVDAIAKGVRDAWDFHLAQHPISTEGLIEEAVRTTFREWLDAHAEDLKARIVAAVAGRLPGP